MDRRCWTILFGLVLISSCGYAQQVPLSESLQFQPIGGTQQQQQQQTSTTQGFNSPNVNQPQQQQFQPSGPAVLQQPQLQQQNPSSQFQGSTVTQSLPANNQFSTGNSLNYDSRFQQIVSGSERFALDLFSRTVDALQSVKYNFILSPFSIWSLLVLTAEGARGKTYSELQRVLGISDDFFYTREVYRQFQNALSLNTSAVELTTTQILYSDRNRPIDPEYERTIENFYNTEQVPVDFLDVQNSLRLINNHIRDATRGRIEKLMTADDLKDATLILASAIFFRGMWRMPFNRSHTTEAPFYDENGIELGRVNMMFQRGPFAYTAIADLDSHILDLPYGTDNRLSMIILLPRKGVALHSVIRRLASMRLQRIYDELTKSAQEFEDDEVEVFIPRFSITADFVLNSVLEQMGILDVFSASHADLSKITGTPVYLSRVMHKAKIDVNEEGTVASAATAGTFANKATPPRFYANRPFAYLIVDKTSNILLFCGQAENPNKF